MPARPTHNSRKESSNSKTHSDSNVDAVQHGKQQQPISILLDIPVESLTHVTSYLAPPSLLALSGTCTRLYEHVKDDITWYRAFLTQAVGVGPEGLDDGKVILLKRLERTWRKEFTLRYRLREKWEYSRNPTITHSPQDSTIDDAHLISENGLLTASIRYGVVARSLPFTGKILQGYLNASGSGLGIGNPNVEFTPDISVCAMSSEDIGTARVFWGKRNGEIAVTTANRVFIVGGATSKLTRCRVGDQHEGMVHCLAVDTPSQTFLSGGADGRVKLWDDRVKLWDGDVLQCLWSSDKKRQSLVPDGFVKVAGGLSQGVIVGGLNSGDICVWTIDPALHLANLRVPIDLPELRINPLAQATFNTDFFTTRPKLRTVHIQCASDPLIFIWTDYTDHPFFYRISVDRNSGKFEVTQFGDPSYGCVSVIEPVYTSKTNETNLVIVGDQLGFVSIYEADTIAQAVPTYKFEAHTDGAVTAIAWTAVIFATGSAHGTTTVWDSLTLEPLHQLMSPVTRPPPGSELPFVSKIILEYELILVIVGNRAMAWKPGHMKKRDHTRAVKGKHTHVKNVVSKGYRQYQLIQDISDSFEELEYEREYTKRAMGREREHRAMLDKLGLDEAEAVQYVLMLSRDEEESRRRNIDGPGDAGGSGVGGEVYEGDFDDLLGTGTGSDASVSSQLRTPISSSSSVTSEHRFPRLVPPTSNEKVQLSPLFVPEPMDAGPGMSPRSPEVSGTATDASSSLLSSLDDFPIIGSSTSSVASSKGSTKSGLLRVGSHGSRPEQVRASAWSTLNKSVLSPGAGNALDGPGGPPASGHRSTSDTTTRSRDDLSHTGGDMTSPKEENGCSSLSTASFDGIEEMDDELRFAIELSLAEARSRGEV
ncbi:hypothetical protein V8B97DRAFT_1875128 [Scleroderma yunnanense]